MSTGRAILDAGVEAAAFETRDFYLACFLRCTGYDLIDLRAEGRRIAEVAVVLADDDLLHRINAE